jgi:hypothetical protein
VVGPVNGPGLTRVGAAPGSEPHGGVVGIAGIWESSDWTDGAGAAAASPPKASRASLWTIID